MQRLLHRVGPGGCLVGLVSLVLLAHLPSLRATQFHYDDGHTIVRNPAIRGFGVGSLGLLPRFFGDPTLFGENPADAMYRPVVLLAHAVNEAVSPGSPPGFLVLNLALHALATVLLFLVLQALAGPDVRAGPPLALAGAALFALHPLQTEVVNYVSARSESLAAVGLLLLVLAFLRYRDGAGGPWLLTLAGAQALALGAKETGVLGPGLILLVHTFHPRGSVRAGRRALALSAVVVSLYLLLYQSIKVSGATPDGGLTRAPLTQLATQIKALAHYLRALATPVDLSVAPQFSASHSLLDPPVLLAAALLASLAGWAWRARRRHPDVTLGLAWSLLCLGPTLVVPLNVLVNDHRPYLALGGIALAAGRLLAPTAGSRRSGRWLPAFAVVATLLCWQRAADWRSEISLWEAAVRTGPAVAAAHHNLAFAYHEAGRLDPARREYERAIALDPDYTRPLTNLGVLCREQGDLDRAASLLLRAVRSDPMAVEPLNNLGLVYAAQGHLEEAIATYRAALRLAPDLADVWLNLGLAQRDAGRREEAFASLQRALQLDPGVRQRLAGGP